MSFIKSVEQFMEAVGHLSHPRKFDVRQTALQIGLQLEEMAEKLDAIGFDGDWMNKLRSISNGFKSGKWDEAVAEADRAAMLDADIDLAWVTIGSAFSQGADVEGASGEVARANLSKLVPCTNPNCVGPEFEDECYSDAVENDICRTCNGLGLVAIKDENGKVVKPSHFVQPNIDPFVCKE